MIYKYIGLVKYVNACYGSGDDSSYTLIESDTRKNLIKGLAYFYYKNRKLYGDKPYEKCHVDSFHALDDEEKTVKVNLDFNEDEIISLADEIFEKYGNEINELQRSVDMYVDCEGTIRIGDAYSSIDSKKYPLTKRQIKLNKDRVDEINARVRGWESKLAKLRDKLWSEYVIEDNKVTAIDFDEVLEFRDFPSLRNLFRRDE